MVTVSELAGFFRSGLSGVEMTAQSRALEARELARFALGMERSASPFAAGEPVCPPEELLARRLSGEPLAYILGAWDFYGRTFKVDSRCLIPRADSETAVAAALEALKPRPPGAALDILDLCSGSGCLGLTLCLELRGMGLSPRVTLADISEGTLEIAAENAASFGLYSEVSLCKADVFTGLDALRGFDLLVCNPPYLSEEDLAKRDASLAFEPGLALVGGGDGLDFYRAIERHLQKTVLKPGGAAVFEFGAGQGDSVLKIFSKIARRPTLHRDLTGAYRALEFYV